MNTPDHDQHQPPAETRDERAARWQADEARRRGIVAGAKDWQEAAQRLHAAGEIGDAVLVALGVAPAIAGREITSPAE
jgi:hypothetical protein